MAALRCLYQRAVDDGLITEAGKPRGRWPSRAACRPPGGPCRIPAWRLPRRLPGPAWPGPGADRRTSRRGPVPGLRPARQDRAVLATAGPGRPGRGRGLVRLGRHRAEDRVRAGPRYPGSGPPCTWTPASPSRSAWRPTPPTRCAPGCQASPGSATGPGGSPSGPRYSRSRSAWPGRSPTTCWPRPERHGRRGPSPRSCPACRFWSWPWGPRWPTCCAPTPLRAHRTTRPEDQPRPRSPGNRSGPGPDQAARGEALTGSGPPAGTRMAPVQYHSATARTTRPDPRAAQQRADHARIVACRLAAAGKPVSRRALRSNGVKDSNEALNALARKISAELAVAAAPRSPGTALLAIKSRPDRTLLAAAGPATALTRTKPPGMPVRSHTRW